MLSKKEILEATIKSTNKRIIEIDNMLQGDTCPVCTLLDKKCGKCPIDSDYELEPRYSCSEFINDMEKIKGELEYQLEDFEARLKKLKAKKAKP